MTDTVQNQGVDDELRLPEVKEPEWDPVEIIYTRYLRDPKDPKRVIADPGSAVYCPGDNHEAGLREFLDDRRAGVPVGKPKYVRKRHCKDTWLHPVSPVDIYFGVAAYIVIELDESTGWQFRKGHPGITLQAEDIGLNFNLGHVMPKGRDANGDGPTGDGCRILYFSAKRRPRFMHQQFHCHIDFGNGINDPVSIDPDIPNDGGKFPIVEESPCRSNWNGYPECK